MDVKEERIMNRYVLTIGIATLLLFASCAALRTSETQKVLTNCIGMKLALIPKGTFNMGLLPTKWVPNTGPQHQVTISNDFYMGVTEVTQAQYQRVMGGNPSGFQGSKVEGDSSNYPVEQITWSEAVEFCKRLSDLPEEKSAGRVYRLPSEAEWEYACRAGNSGAYCFGDSATSIGDYAWSAENGGKKTHAVGQKKPNAWGLYDMHGNVWEWCRDWYSDYPKSAVTDPVGPDEGMTRVVRGGGWDGFASLCQSAWRQDGNPSSTSDSGGFRVALTPSLSPN